MSLLILGVVLAVSEGAAEEGWPRHVIDRSAKGADGVRLRDINGDGRLDLTTGFEESGVVRVYLQPPRETVREPWPGWTVGAVGSPEDAVFVDLDRDGAVDVVSSCEGGERTLFVHWSPKEAARRSDPDAWKTEAFPATRKQQSWMFAMPLDVDGRNGIDVVVGSKGRAAAVGWLQSPEDPRKVGEWKYRVLRPAGWIMSIQSHDLDADGDRDVLFSDRRGKGAGVYWLENPGAEATRGGAKWKEHSIGKNIGEAMFLSTGDVDADGRLDIVCAVKGRGIAWLRATGSKDAPWETHRIPLPPGCGTAKATAVADIDLDGHRDIVFSCENARGGRSGLRWLSADGKPLSGKWRDREISGAAGVKFDRLELVDLDADGDLDVITCEERDNLGIVWYESPTRKGG